ncbi:MAG: hypothetical protein RMJ05_14455 [Thermomicrobium sp.]|nr:hypothetical protein [Thermomicrobium sp.]
MDLTISIHVRRNPARSVAFVLAPILLGVALVVGQANPPFLDDWKRASSLIGIVALFFAAPIAGGVATWASGRRRRSGLDSLLRTMARPWAVILGVELTATLLWLLALVCAIAFGLLLFTTLRLTLWHPWPSYIVVALLAVVQAVIIGAVLGELLPASPVAPIGTALVISAVRLLWLVLLSSGRLDPGLQALLLVPFGHEMQPWLRSSPEFLALMTTWVLGLAGAGCLIVAHGRSPLSRRIVWLAISFSMTVLLAAAVARARVPAVEFVADVPTPWCDGTAPTICVWPEHRWAIPVTRTTVTELRNLLGDRYVIPEVLYEQYLPQAPQQGAPLVRVSGYETGSPSPELLSGLLAGVLPVDPTQICESGSEPTSKSVETLLQRRARYPEHFERWALLRAWLEFRIIGRPVSTFGSAGYEALMPLLALPDEQQRAWFWQQADALRDCSQPLPPLVP